VCSSDLTILSGDLNSDDLAFEFPAGPSFSDNSYHVVTSTTVDNRAVLDGFRITGGNANGPNDNDGGGLYIFPAGELTLRHTTFELNSAEDSGGAAYYGSQLGDATIESCSFVDNAAKFGAAIRNDGWDLLHISNSQFSGNVAVNRGGGLYNSFSDAVLTNCTMTGNSAGINGGGIRNTGMSQAHLTVSNCVLWGNTDADGMVESSQLANNALVLPEVNHTCIQGWTGLFGGVGNIGDDPLFVAPPENVRLRSGSPALDAGNNQYVGLLDLTTDLEGRQRIFDADGDGTATVDLGAYERDDSRARYVDATVPLSGDGTSWAQAYLSLPEALAEAAAVGPNVDEIWVAQGVYKPTEDTDRSATFELLEGVAIYGGFPSGGGDGTFDARNPVGFATVLSGDIGVAGDDSDNAYHVVTATSAGKSAVLDGFTVTGGNADGPNDDDGGGVYISSGAAPTVRQTVFVANFAADSGGAIYNSSQVGSPALIGCSFLGNTAMFGAAVRNDGWNSLYITNSLFSGNAAVNRGGALYNSFADAELTDCTITGNTAGINGGGIRNTGMSQAHLTVSNCVLWGNADADGMVESSQLANNATVLPVVNYTCIQGWTGSFGGVGNIGDDPLFLDPAGQDGDAGTADDDVRFRAGSPCIDAGDNNVVPAGVETDLDGLSRFIDDPTVDPDPGYGTPPVVDMGAYEYQADCNGNGTIDSVDIAGGTSRDCDANGVPDECEDFVDCNNNGTYDPCDIDDGISLDCNANDVPDECEADHDCNFNAVPDECEGSGDTDFDCTRDLDDYNAFAACFSGPDTFYAQGLDCIYLDVDSDMDVDLQDFSVFQGLFGTSPDYCTVQPGPCDGGAFAPLSVSTNLTVTTPAKVLPNSDWVNDVDLSSTERTFYYDDSPLVNLALTEPDPPSFLYWQVDGVPQTAGDTSITITMDQARTAVALFADCNENGVPDATDIAQGTSEDCNENGIPDECLGSGTVYYDIPFEYLLNVPSNCGSGPYGCGGQPGFAWSDTGAGEVAEVQVDFNVGVECHTAGTVLNTTINGSPGDTFASTRYCSCATTAGTLVSVSVPAGAYNVGGSNTFQISNATTCLGFTPRSEWGAGVYARVAITYAGQEPDCNGNSVPDDCDIAGGTSSDCNANGVPDECDIASGGSEDCNGNGVPDECTNVTIITYDVLSTDLINVPNDCGGGSLFACDVDSGFQWQDAGEGRVADVQVAFNVGVECHDVGTVHGTSLNGVPDASYASTATHCSCAYTPGAVVSIDASRSSYLVGGANTFLITGTTECLGFIPQSTWGPDVYARVTVTYAAEVDCNGNGAPDDCDVAGGASEDCNGNAVPDECDIAELFSEDCNGDVVPDECEVAGGQAVIEARDRGWWNSQGAHASSNNNTFTGKYVYPSTTTYYNSYFIFDLPGEALVAGDVLLRMELERYSSADPSETVTIYAVSTDAETLEANGPDVSVYEDLQSGSVYGTFTVSAADVGSVLEIPLSAPAAADVRSANGSFAVGLHLSSTDGNGATQYIRFSAGSEARVHQLVLAYQGDCNGNGVPDDCDISAGTSEDCNLNGVPDECDISSGAIEDCNGNQVPDDCEVASTVVYEILYDDLVNLSYECGGGSYACSGGQPGFTWQDTGTGTVTSVSIEFNVGIECHSAGTTHSTLLNGVPDATFPLTYHNCSCSTTAGSVVTLEVDPASYAVGGLNTFLVTNLTTCFGYLARADWGAGVYARLTVEYADTTVDQDGNGIPDECDVVHFVDAGASGSGDGTSWSDAFTSFADAMGACDAGNQVWVAEGVYRTGGTFFLPHACRVYGGFAGGESVLEERNPDLHVTVLSGDANGDDPNVSDNALHVLTVYSSVGWATILNGFTISGGYADGGTSFDRSGGGMIVFGGIPRLGRLIFTGNHADQRGGALYLSNAGGLTLDRVRFHGNDAANAGAIYMTGSRPVLTNCLFHDNAATGASPGGAGGALANVVSDPLLINCTIADNTAANKGGGIFNDAISGGSDPTLVNCILWDNVDAGGTDESSNMHTDAGTPVVTYTDWQGHVGGTGNIDENPNFTADYRPQPITGVIDGGNNDVDGLPAVDLGGDPRISNGTVDMGAYEY